MNLAHAPDHGNAISLGSYFLSLEISSFSFFFSFFSFIQAWTFISLQIKEFRILGLSMNDSVYSCVFFFLTGLHFLHLVVGLFLLSLFSWSSSLQLYLHSAGASFVFLFLFLHLVRAISYGSYFYNSNVWFSGILLFLFLMAIAFIGYVLPFGQMSFWGATVITNLLSPFPCLIEWVCGGHYVYNSTLKRFFLFHFLLPFLLCGFRILHLFYLHFHSSNNPLRLKTNNKISFLPFIFLKDFFGFILILCLYLLQTHFGISSFSHPDNALEVC
jgi:hypothetical protein